MFKICIYLYIKHWLLLGKALTVYKREIDLPDVKKTRDLAVAITDREFRSKVAVKLISVKTAILISIY